MKKLNLLLATTAMLSLGTMAVNAANPSKEINASVDLVYADNLKVTQDIYFGAWLLSSNDNFYLDMAENGTVTSYSSGSPDDPEDDTPDGRVPLKAGHYGTVTGAPCNTLAFTGDFTKSLTLDADLELSDIRAVGDNQTCNIIAKVSYVDLDGTANLATKVAGTHTFTVTVTAMLGLE